VGTDTIRGNFKDGKISTAMPQAEPEMVTLNNRAYYDGNWDEGVRGWSVAPITMASTSFTLAFGKTDKREGRVVLFSG